MGKFSRPCFQMSVSFRAGVGASRPTSSGRWGRPLSIVAKKGLSVGDLLWPREEGHTSTKGLRAST